MNDVLIEYESSGSERGEVQRMRVTRDEAVAAADRIRASGGTVLEWHGAACACRPVREGEAVYATELPPTAFPAAP